MPTRDEVSYFGAGPAGLPTHSVEIAARAFVNYSETGLGLAEISHRSAAADAILATAKNYLTELLTIPDDYEIIFAHGGGSGAFASVVHNMVSYWAGRIRKLIAAQRPDWTEAQLQARTIELAKTHLRLDYIVTGSWSLKASQEAADLLSFLSRDCVNVAIDSRVAEGSHRKFGSIPAEASWNLTKATPEINESLGAAFTYYCDNETVDGVEFPGFPRLLDRASLVVADMSSNILTRHVDVSKYAVIFAGAQKNIGITDTTIVIVRKDVLSTQVPKSYLIPTPAIMHWPTLAKHGSLYNTIPIFSLYVAADVMKNLLLTYGPLQNGRQAEFSAEKASTIYSILEAHPEIYSICADPGARSRMNICFRIKGGDEEVEKRFIAEAEKQNILGLKGHRSVGGIRVSNYNSVSLKAIKTLSAYMLDFTRTLKLA